MTLIPHKVKRNGHEYYELVDERWVNGKPVIKYAGYLGKSPYSKTEVDPEQIVKYVSSLLKKGISQEETDEVLKKIGIDYDAWPLMKIIIVNDLKMNKVFLKLK